MYCIAFNSARTIRPSCKLSLVSLSLPARGKPFPQVSSSVTRERERERRKSHQKKKIAGFLPGLCGWWKRRCLGKRHCCVTAERRRSASSAFILRSAVLLWSRPNVTNRVAVSYYLVLIVVNVPILAVAKFYYVFFLSYLKIVSSSVL